MEKIMPRNKLAQATVIVLVGFLLLGAIPYLISKAIAQYSSPTISLDSPVSFPVDI